MAPPPRLWAVLSVWFALAVSACVAPQDDDGVEEPSLWALDHVVLAGPARVTMNASSATLVYVSTELAPRGGSYGGSAVVAIVPLDMVQAGSRCGPVPSYVRYEYGPLSSEAQTVRDGLAPGWYHFIYVGGSGFWSALYDFPGRETPTPPDVPLPGGDPFVRFDEGQADASSSTTPGTLELSTELTGDVVLSFATLDVDWTSSVPSLAENAEITATAGHGCAETTEDRPGWRTMGGSVGVGAQTGPGHVVSGRFQADTTVGGFQMWLVARWIAINVAPTLPVEGL